MQEALVVRRETHVPAPPATVFAFLTDPDKILRWMGTEAQIEPRSGGIYLLNVTGARKGSAIPRRRQTARHALAPMLLRNTVHVDRKLFEETRAARSGKVVASCAHNPTIFRILS
jgi:hypothetical protein